MNVKSFWKPAVWLVIICYGLFVPSDKLPAKNFFFIPHMDKIIHFGLFLILCLLLYKPLKQNRLYHKLLAPLTAVLFAIILESIQHTVSVSRYSNFPDFLANVAGIVVGAFVYLTFISGKNTERFF